jgi:heterodisulfide reductase subunit B2
MVTLSYFPGCSLKTGSKFYETSVRKVFSFYGIELKEIDDWSCCGASAAHTVDEELAHALVARNLALAEREDAPFFAPCSACYSRSKITNDTVKMDSELQNKVNSLIAPLECTGSLEIKNIIEVLDDHVGLSAIAKQRKYDLSGVKVVPYYGCVLTRLMRVKPYDDRENPESMDRLLEALGVEVLPWPFKMECCGASKTLTDREMPHGGRRHRHSVPVVPDEPRSPPEPRQHEALCPGAFPLRGLRARPLWPTGGPTLAPARRKCGLGQDQGGMIHGD